MAIRLKGVEKPSALRAYNEAAGTYRLGSNPNLYEIQRTNNFEFQVAASQFDNIVTVGGKNFGALPDGSSGPSDIIRIAVQSTAIPHFTQGVLEVKRGNNTIKYAGVPSFDAGSLDFNDFIGADVKSILMAWQNMSYNVDTEKVGALDVTPYKNNCYLIEYTPDYRKVRTWRLYGCWISALSEGEYSADSGDKHQISCTIEYDRAQIDLTESI